MPADGIGQYRQELHGLADGFNKGLRSRYARHPHNRRRRVDAVGIADIVITFYKSWPEDLDPGGGERQGGIMGTQESAGINRFGVGNARVLQ